MKNSPPMTHAGQNWTEESSEHVDQNCSKENPFSCTCWLQKALWLHCLVTKVSKKYFRTTIQFCHTPARYLNVQDQISKRLSNLVNYLGYKVPNKVCTEHITLFLKKICGSYLFFASLSKKPWFPRQKARLLGHQLGSPRLVLLFS